jgi:hypothetical protein
MQGIAQAFSDGGPFMFVILLFGLATLALTIVQFVIKRRTDLSPLLWGLLLATLLVGGLGTVMGFIQGFSALEMVAPDMRAAMTARMIAIAANTTALSLLFAVPLSIVIGVASFLARRARRRQQAAG